MLLSQIPPFPAFSRAHKPLAVSVSVSGVSFPSLFTSQMLSRIIHRPLPLRFLTLPLTAASFKHHLSSTAAVFRRPYLAVPRPLSPSHPAPVFHCYGLGHFSSNRGDGSDDGSGGWKLTPDDKEIESVFGEDVGNLAGIAEGRDDVLGSFDVETVQGVEADDAWKEGSQAEEGSKGDIFDDIDREFQAKKKVVEGVEDDWETAEGYKPWSLGEGDPRVDSLFAVREDGELGIEGVDEGPDDIERDEEQKQLEKKEEELLATLKGPNRAFGDLIAASGITDDMIDSLILLKDVRGVPGLPPLSEIEDKAIARMNATSSRAEIERKKQEEIAKARVRQVDEKGRAYGTGRRKCSIARVWLQPGDGKFVVNDKQFDAYFPVLDHRAELLRPFAVTETLGLWDVNSTVKGGGVSGQVGAIRLGVSRALQNWEPGFRPYLKAAGYLTRDSRVVERKKPGKAKARKSFQWVKR